METETIVAVAYRVELSGKEKVGESYDYIIISLPAPARHHHILHTMAAWGHKLNGTAGSGFLTSTGRFVDRVEAMTIAMEASQVINSMRKTDLYSEDLW